MAVNNSSVSSKPLWEFESVGYLDAVEPSWLHGNSYPCLATDFTPSSVMTTSSCASPELPSSITTPTSSPVCGWKMYLSSDVPTSVHTQADLSFSVDSTSEADLPFGSNAVGAFFNVLPSDAIWDDYNCSPENKTGRQPLVTLAHFRPAPPAYSDASRYAQQKGLSGWGDTTNLKDLKAKRPRSRSQSPSRSKSNTGGNTVLSSLSLTTGSVGTSPRRDSKRTRHESVVSNSSLYTKVETSDDDEPPRHDDQDDSDDYRPSCSPSPTRSSPASPLHDSSGKSGPLSTTARRGRPRKIKGEKATGSAALALAVVTQVGEARREAQSCQQPDLEHDWFDPVRVYREGSYMVKKRRNQSIPVPVPVPNLNKKSRGRKVPFISTSSVTSGATASIKTEEGSTESNQDDRGSRWTERKGNSASIQVKDGHAGSRTFVCVVPGCGKCFVRGEHLKRHVRSIHTHDKRRSFKLPGFAFLTDPAAPVAHVCPFEGCDKSFSRRDNLGQHVRIHLQQ